MSVKSEVSKLKETDIWSLLLFVLFKIKDTDEFSSLSELTYILDKTSLLKLCEYFGGSTITIPTIDELEHLVYGLLLYQYVDIDKLDYNDALAKIYSEGTSKTEIKLAYKKIKETLDTYTFTSRSVK